MLRRVSLVVALVWLCPALAWAVDPSRRISQYAHTAWRLQDGAFTGVPFAIAQSTDGYLWVGTAAGLLRFDGVRFVPWNPGNGQQLPSADVQSLRAARDGSLWIGTSGGLSRWKDGTLVHYPTGPGGVMHILEDRHGAIWFGGNLAGTGTGPFCRVTGAEPQCVSLGGDVPSFRAQALHEDRDGSLWAGGDTTLVRWNGESRTVYKPGGLQDNSGMSGILGLASTPDGTLWVGVAKAGPGLGLQRLSHGRWQPFATPEFDSSTLGVSSVQVDREAAVWVATYDRGLFRIVGDRVDRFDRATGLSSDSIVTVLEDREGNVWVVTSHGIDRFADTPVVSVSATEGVCSPEVASVLATRDGSVWTGGDGALSRLKDGVVTCLRSGKELPGSQPTSLFEDRAGRLWVGLDQGLWVYQQGGFRQVHRTDGRSIGMVTGIAEDADENLWITAAGPPRILMRVQGLTVSEDVLDPPLPRRVAADPTGGLWLGLVNGDLAHLRDGTAETYRFAHSDAALLAQVLPDVDGSVLAATSYGLIGWHNGRQLTLTAKNGLPCDEVYSLSFDSHGNLWLFMNCALGVLAKGDLQTWKANPDTRVSVRTLGVLDGVRTGLPSFVAAGRSPDGRLWFGNGSLLQMVDPERLQRNALPPPVHVEQVVADRQSYPATGVVRLPALTRDLQIDYVGLSFVAPQKVQFRYWLEGRDTTWQEAGTRRQAFYNDLRPGTYRFRVIASNNDGVWNDDGATLQFVIAPAWHQTTTFVVFCVMTGMVGAWAAYQLRMRQVARSLNARFDERLDERTRMARDLHDTLLQTVQGTKMVADTALDRPDDAAGMRRAMGQVSTWLGQASTEGRAAVTALRTSTTETNDLAAAFQRAIDDCRRLGTAEASLTVTGDVRAMHPVVRDEVYRIGYEAIRNACTHAGASKVDIVLGYAWDLTLRVVDNGVGIEPAVTDDGKAGHFGLQGMRERAGRIGATLTVVSTRGGGTEVALLVPGRVIFRTPGGTLLSRVAAVVKGAVALRDRT